jgi:hypothetical protein
MLAILKNLGRVEDVDAARVQALRSLSDAVDRFPKNAQLWRVYRDAIEDLLTQDDRANDDLEKALAEIRSAGPIRDAAAT